MRRFTRFAEVALIGACLLVAGVVPAGAQQSSGSKKTLPGAKSSSAVAAPKARSSVAPKPAPASRTTSLARARAAAAARARVAAASAALRQQQDAMVPRFKRDLVGNLVPDVRAAAAIV